MRILFIGDIVGKPGVAMVQQAVPALKASGRVDFVIANAENAANSGSGCTPADYRRLRDAGVDLVTLGDHIFKKAEIIGVLEKDERICKPANLSPSAPGNEFALATAADGTPVAAFSLLGRTFMRPADDPYVAADRVLANLAGKAQIIILDMHAEATADKYLMAHYLNGRVAAVIGTHTHVPTADEQILPGGTAFICDVGMTGPYASILGRRVDRVLSVSVTAVPAPFEVATDDVRLGGAVVDVDSSNGRARSIQRVTFTQMFGSHDGRFWANATPPIENLISGLESARTRPEMYFGEVDPNLATHYLNGLESTVSAFVPHGRFSNVREQVLKERGLPPPNGRCLASQLAERGMSAAQIVDEILAVDVEVLKRLSDFRTFCNQPRPASAPQSA